MKPESAIVREETDLHALGQAINAAAGRAVALSKKGVEEYRLAGELLNRAKAMVRHGQWGDWLEANVAISSRQCNNYMLLAKTEKSADLQKSWEILNGSGENPAIDAPILANYPSPPEKVTSRAERVGQHKPESFSMSNGVPERESGDEDELDAAGQPIPKEAREAFATAAKIKDWGNRMDAMVREMADLIKLPGGRLTQFESAAIPIRNGKNVFVQNRATHVCPMDKCEADGKKCPCCKGEKWTCAHVWQRLKEERKVKK